MNTYLQLSISPLIFWLSRFLAGGPRGVTHAGGGQGVMDPGNVPASIHASFPTCVPDLG